MRRLGIGKLTVAVTHPPPGFAGSTPARRTGRKPIWPCRLPEGHHPLKVETRVRLPSGLLDDGIAGWRNGRRASLRRSCPSLGVGVRLSPRRLRVGRCSAETHNLGLLGSTPRPATSSPPGRQTGKAASPRDWCLWVRLPPRRLLDRRENAVPWSNGNDVWVTSRKRWFDSIRDDCHAVRRCYGRHASSVGRRFGFESRADLCWFGNDRAAGPTGRHLPRTQEIGVRLPGGPLSHVRRAHGPTGRHRPGVAEIRVRLPVGPLRRRKVAGYGWPGLGANECARKGVRVRIPGLPL